MPIINYDLSNMRDDDDLVPGKYLAKLIDMKEDVSSKGNRMYVWTWEIIDGGCEGQTIPSFTTLLDGKLGNLRRTLEALGLKDSVKIESEKLHDKRACLIIGDRTITDRDTKESRKVPCVISVHPASMFKKLPLETVTEDE